MARASFQSFGFIVAVTVLVSSAAQVFGVRDGWSIPAFGRKYQFSCQDCHVYASPKLNEFGEGFREQGYQLPADHSRIAETNREDPGTPVVIFERYCEACHGVKGHGDGPMGQVLVPPAANLTTERIQSRSDDDLLRIIREGSSSTTMPAFKHRLTPQQLQGVLTYIRSLSD